MQTMQRLNLQEKTQGKSLLRALIEHTLILWTWTFVPTAAAPLPNISQSLWIPVRLEQLLSQHDPPSCLLHKIPDYSDCLVSECLSIFSLRRGGSVLLQDLRRGVINNICPVSSYSGRKWEKEEEEGGESHSWNSPEPVCKQKLEVSMEGKGHI